MEHQGTLAEIAHYMQAVIDFAASRHLGRERRAALAEFFGSRYLPRGREPDLDDRLSVYLDWFMFDRALTTTGQSVVRQFVTEHPGLSARVRENLLGCEQSIYSTFEVKEINERCVVVLDLHGEPDDYYAVAEQAAAAELSVEDLITTRLIRWDDRYYFYGLIEKWPPHARPLFLLEADALRGARLDPCWREQFTQQFALNAPLPRSRSEWVRQKRCGL